MRFKLPWTVCRACLREGQMYSVFEKDSIGMTMAEKITLVTDVKVVPDKNYPQEICRQCLILLNSAYEFQIRCRKSDCLLKMCIKQKTHNEQGATKSVALTMSNGKVYLMPKDITVRSGSAVINTGMNQECNSLQSKNNTKKIQLKPNPKVTRDVLGTNIPIASKNPMQIIDKNRSKLKSIIHEDSGEDGLNFESDNEAVDLSYSVDKVKILKDIALEPLSEEKIKLGKCSKKIDSNKLAASTTCNQINTAKKRPIGTKATMSEKKPTEPTAVRSYVCELCGNKYRSKPGFDLHMRRHRNERPFECEICHMKFFQDCKLTLHMRRHTGERPYSCSYCDRKFISKKSKHLHERMHTGEKPYPCNICNKRFSYSYVLARHRLIHGGGPKNFVCEPCGKQFRFKSNLEAHCKTATHIKSTGMDNVG